MNQDAAGGLQVQPPASHIEQYIVVDMPGGCSVTALDIISVNQQAGLAICLGVVGQEQVFIGLVSVGLLSVFTHYHVPPEDRPGAPVQDALVVETAGAV